MNPSRYFAILVLLAAISALAVPQQINYQGTLTSPTGTALDTTVAMTFKLYTDSTAGTLLWTETRPSVVVQKGLFNARLGQLTALPDATLNQPQVWLSITVGNNSEMSPRTRIVSSAYSYRVGTVDGASGGTITSDVNVAGKANIGSGNTNNGLLSFVNGESNAAAGDYSVIAGGYNNSTAQVYSTVSGGTSNSASQMDATVSGGSSNVASNQYATVGGGTANAASGHRATVGGGDGNYATGDVAFVGGGLQNTASDYATVGGGYSNSASGTLSAVGGGEVNTASGAHATVGGGGHNVASGAFGTVAGGGGLSLADSNSASGQYTAIGGGNRNLASGFVATVAGGSSNVASGIRSFVGGGGLNSARGDYSVIAGGGGTQPEDSNRANWPYATISGGRSNSIGLDYGTVGGGEANSASSWAVVAGGHNNAAWGNVSAIGGGLSNSALGAGCAVGGGSSNLADGVSSAVGGGYGNVASGYYSCVPGGYQNCALGGSCFAAGSRARSNFDGCFVWGSSLEGDSTVPFNTFSVTFRSPNGTRFYTTSSGTGSGVYLSGGGGSWQNLCDAHRKNFHGEVNTSDILQKVATLPLQKWSYKSQDESIQHIGPTAQDFRAAFELGESDTTINTLDPDGVALAAIQELARENQELKQQLSTLLGRVQALEAEDKQSMK